MLRTSISTLLPWCRLLAVGATSLLAFRRTEQAALKFYFASEAIVTLAIESMQIGHWPGYVPVYLLLRPSNFATALWAVPPTLPAALTAVLLAWVTYLAVSAQFSLYAAVALLQGSLYVLLGASAVRRQPVLAITWLALGVFNLAFAVGWRLPLWEGLNQWWLAAVTSAGFLAFSLRERTPATPRQDHLP
jgi:hypothetical protein